MRGRCRQHGYLDLDGFYLIFGILAAVGVITLIVGVPYGIWWLIDNFDIVRTR